ncbi:MAG: YggS family pyridoxal phosphate-dependent enzyme [Sphingomonadales bacterium]|nr:YggS family pyridoxal phosphate-dependent enzyme [Sphingomonadales bacterium]
MALSSQDIATNLAAVDTRIAEACRRANRDARPTVIAVSKGQPLAAIEAALAAGHRVFGENRVEEAVAKWPALKERFPDVELHMIGGLQTRKVRDAVGLFDVIQSLDRPKLARKLAAEMTAQNRVLAFTIQVNTGEEPQKGGVVPSDLPGLLSLCRDELGLAISGLMCLPPADEEPSPHFALLVKLARRHGLETLSMGMSGDFEVAAALGATHVRVGTAIFGPRSG